MSVDNTVFLATPGTNLRYLVLHQAGHQREGCVILIFAVNHSKPESKTSRYTFSFFVGTGAPVGLSIVLAKTIIP